MRYKAFIIAAIIIFTTGNSHALQLKVDIVNATKNEKMVSYPFSVKVMDPSQGLNSAQTLELQTGPDGNFEGVIAVTPQKSVRVDVNYRGISYSSQPRAVRTGTENLSFLVPVYSITDRKEDTIVTERVITLIPRDDRVIQVFEHLRVENSGNATYVGKFNDELDLNQVLFIPMPAGYMLTSLQGIDSSRVYTLSNALVSREEIKPGTHSVRLNYHIISDTGLFDFTLLSQKDAPETRYISLYFPKDSKWDMELSQFKPAGEQVMGNKTYSMWKGLASTAVRMKVYGPTYERTTSLWIFSILLLFGVSIAALYLCRIPVRLWFIKREKKRLETILSGLSDGADEKEFNEYYRPFIRVIRGRLEEIDQRLGI